jgi:hypothetical protein
VWVSLTAFNLGGTSNDNSIMGAGVASTNNGLHMGERQGGFFFGFYGSLRMVRAHPIANDVATSNTTFLVTNTWFHVAFV